MGLDEEQQQAATALNNDDQEPLEKAPERGGYEEEEAAAKALMTFSHGINRNTITKRKNFFKHEIDQFNEMKLKNPVNPLSTSSMDENTASANPNPVASPQQQQQQPNEPRICMKDLNKEERLRIVREKREQEIAKRKKEIEENLKRKEELRDKQLKDRKKRIDELKLRENSKHLAVGERRKQREELARVRNDGYTNKKKQKTQKFFFLERIFPAISFFCSRLRLFILEFSKLKVLGIP